MCRTVLFAIILMACSSCSDGTSSREHEVSFQITPSLYDGGILFLSTPMMQSASSLVRAEVILEDGTRLPWTTAVNELIAQAEAFNRLIIALSPNVTVFPPGEATLEPSQGGVFISDPSRLLLDSTIILIVKG